MIVDEMNVAVAIPQLAELAEFRYQLRTFLSFSESASEKCGVAAQQYQLLQVIAAIQPGRQASISYVAERMILRHNSTVELVDRAERAGLVARRNDETDLRRSLLHLTPHGWEVLRKLVAMHLEELHRHTEPMIGALRKVHASAIAADQGEAGASGN